MYGKVEHMKKMNIESHRLKKGGGGINGWENRFSYLN